jgi:endonuclease-3
LVHYFGIPARQKRLPNPIDTLIATILSQNTNDNNSYRAYQNLKKKYPTLRKLSSAKRTEIEKVIRAAGLGKQKSGAIKSLLTTINKNGETLNRQYFKNKTDDEILEVISSIKGIGVKTASCVLLFSLNRNVCPVDTHVHRTLNKIGIVNTKTPEKTFEQIKNNLPEGIAHQFHTNLIKLGRGICKPAKPLCSICPIFKQCEYKHKNLKSVKAGKRNGFLLLDSI